MAWTCILFVLLLGSSGRSCHGFGFDIYHRFSDPVMRALGVEGLPEKGSVEYYAALARRDRLVRGNGRSSPVTFANGNNTRLLTSLGFDLSWLPCDCKRGGCSTGFRTSSGWEEFTIYDPNNSSTSRRLPCNSSLCRSTQCPSASSDCAYQVLYRSKGTSSSGILVEDVLHLITNDDQKRAVEARIIVGCGQIQTGLLLTGVAAPNGFLGLGMGDISVPSTLARTGIASNSFSLCFRPNGVGRISFGSHGSSDQRETPFNVEQSDGNYHISITEITVGRKYSEQEFSALVNSGTSFTHLKEPAYTFVSKSFNSQIREKRRQSDPLIPFEYCFELSPNQKNSIIPNINLTMKGGDQYFITSPTVLLSTQSGMAYCLAVVKSEDWNIIGASFMTGYRLVFDRERMILGWKPSNCSDDEDLKTPTNNSIHPCHDSSMLKSFTRRIKRLLVSFSAIIEPSFRYSCALCSKSPQNK